MRRPLSVGREQTSPRKSTRRRYRSLRGESLERRQLLAAEIEPNDTTANATPLPPGDLLEGRMQSVLDLDFFSVDLDRGDAFSINTRNINAPRFSPTLPPGLQILDSAGRTLATSADGDALGIVAPSTGTYFVRVTSENAFGTFIGPYAMQSSYTPDTGNAFQFNQISDPAAFIDISGSGTSLNLGDDSVAVINSTVGNALLPAGNLTVSNNGVIYSDTGSSTFSNGNLPSASFGQALFPFWDDLDDDNGDVYWEERQVGGINTLIVQWHERNHFSLQQGQNITFQVQLFESGPVLARLAYRDAFFGDANFDNGRSATIGYQLDSNTGFPFSVNQASVFDGDVLEIVRDASDSGTNDTITSAYSLVGSFGEQVVGSIDSTADLDYYFFDATAGQTFALAFAGLSVSNPTVSIVNAELTPFAVSDDGSGIAYEVEADGRYYVEVSAGSEIGEFVFLANLLNDAQVFGEDGGGFAGALALETAKRGTFVGKLDSPEDRDLFRFEIDDIEFLRFDIRLGNNDRIVESGKDLRIYNDLGQLVVYSPSGIINTEVDDALVPGTYYLEVLANSPVGDGAYAIDYRTITNFSLQRDTALHVMEFSGNNQFLGGFTFVNDYAVPGAIPYYEGIFASRYNPYEVEVTNERPHVGKERVAQGIGDFGDIGAGGFGGGGRGFRSSNGEAITSAREQSVGNLSLLRTPTVMHEFGHGVGLPHARDYQAFMSYVGTTEYLPVGQAYAFQGTDNRRPGTQTYDVRDYLDFTLQPGAQVVVPEAREDAEIVSLDPYFREMSLDQEPVWLDGSGRRPFDIVTGDFNFDGLDDFVVANSGELTGLNVFISLGDGTFQPVPNPPQVGALAWWTDPLEVADFNNDGNDDLIVIDNADSTANVFVSTGDGMFAAPTVVDLSGRPQGLEVADLNDDGAMDLIVSVRSAGVDSIELHFGAGNGAFVQGLGQSIGVDENPHGVAAGDFNGDGAMDISVTSFDQDELLVFVGDGTRLDENPLTFPVGDQPDSLVASDFNDDGIDDMALVYRDDQAVEIFFSDSNLDLVSSQAFDARTSVWHIALDDVDGDDTEDLIVAGAGDAAMVLLGETDGSFTRPIAIQTGNREALAAAGDFDQDGENEMVVLHYGSASLVVTDTPTRNAELNDRVVVFGAIDDDGDVDEYTMQVSDGERMRIDIDSAEFLNPLDSIVSVYSSSGVLLAMSDDAIDGNTGIESVDPFLDFVFDEADTVTIRVEGKSVTAGPYRLKVTPERAIETVGPTILAMFPDNRATVNATRELTFYLDSVVDPNSLTPENVQVLLGGNTAVSGTAAVNPLDSTIVWTADQPLEAGDYQIRLVSGAGGITDLAGNPLDGAVDANFSFPDRSGDPNNPAQDFTASITINGPDTSPATVIRISQNRDPYNASRFIVRLNDQLLASSVHTADYVLREAGEDGVFDTDDDTTIALDATYESIRSKANSILYLYSRGVVDTGNYRIEADLIDAAGNAVTLSETIAIGGTVSELNLFTDATLTSTGLTGSYVNSSVTADEPDWRTSQTISGTRVDPRIGFFRSDWGTRAEVGVTGGSDENWDRFSVQWDGFIQVPRDGVQLQTTSDDSSRFWVDINRDGTFDPNELFDNGWGGNQGVTTGESTPQIPAGVYQVRIQYQEAAGDTQMHFEWIVPDQAGDVSGVIHGPAVTGLSLTPGAQHLTETTSTLDITFSGNIDPATLTGENFSLTYSENASFDDDDNLVIADADGFIEWNPATLQATLQFATPLALGFYLLNINGDEGGVRSTAGYLLDGEFVSNSINGNSNPFIIDRKPSGNGIQGGDYVAQFAITRPALDVDVEPGSISERDGQATVTISRRFADVSNTLFVSLSVSDETELRLGTDTVQIAPGEESVTVQVFGVDDNFIDGPQQVAITAEAIGLQDGFAFVTVTDFESFDLQLSAPAIFENNDRVTMTLTREDASVPTNVNLSSSIPTRLGISPPTVAFAAGQSTATVTLIGVDNQLLDGIAPVSITASSQIYEPASIDIDLLDYEPLVLTTDLDSISEDGGETFATLTRTDPRLPLITTLAATPDGLVTLPTRVTFAQGQAVSAPFLIAAVDNQTVDGQRFAAITASGPGYINGTYNLAIADFEELEFVSPGNVLPENSGRVTMQLRRTDPSGPLLASLSSDNLFRLRTPPTASFADGELLSAPFEVTIVDNNLPDGNEMVSLSAAAFGYQLGLFDVLITDFEPLELRRLGGPVTESSDEVLFELSRPTAAGEAVIQLGGDVISLFDVPESFVFPADRTTVQFTAQVIENDFVGANAQVTVTASSNVYVSDSVSFEIEDNDVPSLLLVLETPELIEGGRATEGRLLRNTRNELFVSVTSSEPGLLDIPDTLRFPSGQGFLDFEFSVNDDNVASGERSVELTFSAVDHPTVIGTVRILDDEIAGFEFSVPSLTISEGNSPGRSGLVLTSEPASDIRLTLMSSDESQITVSPTEVLFTPDNWDIVQTIVVDSIDDLTVEAARDLSIVASVAADSGPFATVQSRTLSVHLEDDDVARILLQETGDSTIVDEFGMSDRFHLRLGAQPAENVTLVVDGSSLPSAVFSPAQVVFTPDNWDQPRSIVVTTPLDFDADGNHIGSVFVNVDVANSDPQFALAGQRTLAVVEVDAILNDLRLRRRGDALDLINNADDRLLRSSSLLEPGGGVVAMGSRSERVTVESLGTDREIAIDTAAGNDTITLESMLGSSIDGGSDYDRVVLLSDGELPSDDLGGAKLRNIEEIDLSAPFAQRLVLDEQRVREMTDENNRLFITIGEGDELVLQNGFAFDAPIVVNGFASHTLIKDDAIVQVSNGTLWQNPLDRFDVDRSGDIGVRDALVTINRLARQPDSELPVMPESIDELFYDVNGDGAATPSDALAVVNRLAAIASGGGDVEQRSWAESVDRVNAVPTSGWLARESEDEDDTEETLWGPETF